MNTRTALPTSLIYLVMANLLSTYAYTSTAVTDEPYTGEQIHAQLGAARTQPWHNHTHVATQPHWIPVEYRIFGMGGYGNGSSWAAGAGAGLAFAPIERWSDFARITPGMEVSATYWSGRSGTHNISRLRDIGLTLLLRFEPHKPNKGFFFEGGFGLHQLSETRFYSKNLGRHSQAGSNIAIGYYIPRTPFEVSIRGRHLSNARTRKDNSGINQLVLRIATYF